MDVDSTAAQMSLPPGVSPTDPEALKNYAVQYPPPWEPTKNPLAPNDLPESVRPAYITPSTLVVSKPSLVLHGWTEQKSPACAAASVAGVLNGLKKLRGLESHLEQWDTLEIYKEKKSAEVDEAKSKLADVINVPVSALFDLDKLLLPSLQTKKKDGKAINFGGFTQSLKQVVASSSIPAGNGSSAPSPMLGVQHKEEGEDDSEDDDDDDDEDDDAESVYGDDEELPIELAEYQEELVSSKDGEGGKGGLLVGTEDQGRTVLAALKAKGVDRIVSWRVYNLLMNLVDLHDLSRPKPLTSSVGNNWVLDAGKILGKRNGLDVEPWTLMAGYGSEDEVKEAQEKGDVAELPVLEKDEFAIIDKQWRRLLQLLEEGQTALIYHMPGHYAHIFAARAFVTVSEYIVAGREETRQLLTGHPGQQPNCWVDFAELRKNVIDHSNCALMAFRSKV